MENSIVLIVAEVLLGFALILVLLFNKNVLFNSKQSTTQNKQEREVKKEE